MIIWPKKEKIMVFVLLHSVGSFPHDSEIDTPLNYADYYYLEALKRYKDLKEKSENPSY